MLEGVETREQALISIDAGVDFVQGFYFTTPSINLEELTRTPANFDELLDEYKSRNQVTFDPTRQLTEFFRGYFVNAIDKLRDGAEMHQACLGLLNHQAVSRCYLVNEHGIQIADTIISDTGTRSLDPRFKPLESTSSADWFRQEYLRQALALPDNLHVTAPYLCVTGAYMCITLSQATPTMVNSGSCAATF